MALFLLPAVSAPNDSRWSAGTPAPEWVQVAARLPSDNSIDAAKWGDTRYMLVDDQIRTTAEGEESFHHRATKVLASTGIDTVSQITFEFDPSYTSLAIHEISIWRGNRKINALDPTDLKVLQRETDLHRRIYDGSLQVVAFLRDVRVGDVVERSWSVSGRNPAMGDHHASRWNLGWTSAVAHRFLRVLSGGRDLHFKHFQTDLRPTIEKRGRWTEYRWTQDDVPAVKFEDDTPSWAFVYPAVQISDFTSWAEVGRWEADHYGPLVMPRALMPAELENKITIWEMAETEERKAQQALRFVQDDVRYMGIEIGPS
ncbi:MAG: DUF3857 domain-containing protein, partial [Acidobacteria bacterium]|nr:DUF3857 domain-containing protein [Acidobacteriota bacterium]